MDDLNLAIAQTLPEMLARDLADQEHVFLARSITAGPPVTTLAFAEPSQPHVPNRNPGRVAARMSHRTAPETVLCPSRQNNQGATWRHGRGAFLIDALTRRSSLGVHKHDPMPDLKEYHLMKRDTERDARGLSLGQSEDWGSDTSAELGPGMSSPCSARTRQQSITTAATSVDAQFPAEGRGQGVLGCESVPCSPEKSLRFTGDVRKSWFDLESEMLRAEEEVRREIEVQRKSKDLHRPRTAPSAGAAKERDRTEQTRPSPISVPQRCSSLSCQFTNLILGETAHSRKWPTRKLSSEMAPRLRPAASSRSLPHQLPVVPVVPEVPAVTHHDGEQSGPSGPPIVSTARRQQRHADPVEEPGLFSCSSKEFFRRLLAQKTAQIDPLESISPPNHLFDSGLHPRGPQIDSPEKPPPEQLWRHREPRKLQTDPLPGSFSPYKLSFDRRAPHHMLQGGSKEIPCMPSDRFSCHRAALPNSQSSNTAASTVPPELPFYRREPRQNLRLDLLEPFLPTPLHPLSCNQTPQNLQLDRSQTSAFDQLSLPPLSTHDTNHNDALSTHRSEQQHSMSPFKSHKSPSANRFPLLSNIQHWLEFSTNAQQCPPPTLSPTCPAMSPASAKIRIPGPVLENINAMVKGFPETMLSTDTLAVQMVRDYSRMVKRDHVSRIHAGNVPTMVESSNTPIHAQSHSQPQPQSQSRSMGRKASRANLNFVHSLRGKFGGRLASSATTPDLYNLSDMQEDSTYDGDSICATLPEKKKTDGCVSSLRTMFPDGTDYLLDALYANILVYNYVNSACGGQATMPQNGADTNLRDRPPKNFALPSGVTSLADLELQLDSSETVLKDWQDDVSSVASRLIVPTKAAFLLGIGDTNTGRPLPNTSSRLGRHPPAHKMSHSGGYVVQVNSSSSDAVMLELRDDIAHNIYRLTETMKSCGADADGKVDVAEDNEGVVASTNASQLDPTLMRALCEVVRCYEEITALRGGA